MNILDELEYNSGIDCHVHSVFSPDARRMGAGDPQELADEAKRRGLRGFIVTDHIDTGHWLDSPPFDFERYFDTWNAVRDRNPELCIRIGLEVGFEAHTANKTAKLIDKLPLEYVINSVHYWREPIKSDTGYDNCYINEKLDDYADYLRAVIASLDAPYGFDVIGHLGFPERYSPFAPDERAMNYSELKDLFDEIIEKAIARGVRFEENTSGGGDCFFQPREEFLRAYKSKGGARPVLGSDAHVKDKLGARFDRAKAFLDGIFG